MGKVLDLDGRSVWLTSERQSWLQGPITASASSKDGQSSAGRATYAPQREAPSSERPDALQFWACIEHGSVQSAGRKSRRALNQPGACCGRLIRTLWECFWLSDLPGTLFSCRGRKL